MINSGTLMVPKPNNVADPLSTVLHITTEELDFNIIDFITHELNRICGDEIEDLWVNQVISMETAQAKVQWTR